MAEKGSQRKRYRGPRSLEQQAIRKRSTQAIARKEPSPCCEELDELQHLVGQNSNNFMDSDETQPSSESQDMFHDSIQPMAQTNLESMPKRKNGRGKAKCLFVDMKTESGRKIKVHIPENIGRAVGDNARNVVNFCGVVVRSEAKLSYKTWPIVKKEVGDIMLAKVKDKFEMDEDDDDQLFNSFIFCTMRRLYRVWKCRLHKQWSKLNENERTNLIPKDVGDDDWSGITAHWESEEFKVSELYKDGKADINLLNLAMGPHRKVNRYDTYVINGFRFHTKERERFLKCQNSGVVVKGDVCTNIHEYYGVLTDIYKFSFMGGNDVFLFKCHWWDVSRSGIGCKTDKWGYTYVNSSHSLKTNEKFVLAVQAEQVYYVKNINNSQWLVVCKHFPRDAYLNESFSKDDELTEDTTTDDGEPYQIAEVRQSTFLQLDDVVEDSRTEGLCRNDFEASIVIKRIAEDFNRERVEDDDNLENDEDGTDFDDDE